MGLTIGAFFRVWQQVKAESTEDAEDAKRTTYVSVESNRQSQVKT